MHSSNELGRIKTLLYRSHKSLPTNWVYCVLRVSAFNESYEPTERKQIPKRTMK